MESRKVLSVETDDISCTWGVKTTLNQISSKMDACYDSIVRWKKNFFLLPRGNSGKHFIVELTRLINLYNNDTLLKAISLKSVMIFLPLMLQKPSKNSKARDHAKYLSKRLDMWKEGNIQGLLDEANEIQKRLVSSRRANDFNLTKKFTNLMLKGKLSQASRLINRDSGGLLKIDEAVKAILLEKHPEGQPINREALETNDTFVSQSVQEVIFEPIDGDMVAKAAMKTEGSGGPTLIDSDCWKQILCSKNFKQQQADLCNSIAELTKKLCVTSADPTDLRELLASRLIPLDKNPGVRPIGIGEILRRIIGKCVTWSIKEDIESSAGGLQTCAGHKAGIEAAIHAIHDTYKEDECEGLLLVDASNAFNSLNRKVALANMSSLCPPFFQYLQNTYSEPSRLYLSGGNGQFIHSSEGTTQGDNCAMAFYAISTVPIIRSLANENVDPVNEKCKQAWFADDASAAGKLMGILKWWNKLVEVGPRYGYFPNPNKCVLIVKSESMKEKANEIFGKFGIQITCRGQRHLGAIVGTQEYKEEYIREKVGEWKEDVKTLASIAKTEPQGAYSAMVFAIQHRWKFIQRTVPEISEFFEELEYEIHHTLLPALIGREISDLEREIIALPVRLGGLGIPMPNKESKHEYEASRQITNSLKDVIISQKLLETCSKKSIQDAKSLMKMLKGKRTKLVYNQLLEKLDSSTKRALEIAKEKGASSWLTTLPLDWLGYTLNRQEFRDSIALRYSWKIKDMPAYCGCGKENDIDHSLSCKKGGYVILRHNNIRDTTAKVLEEVCYDVQIEPRLIPINGESEEVYDTARGNIAENARLDVAARGVWSQYDRSFVDIRVTHPNCLSNSGKSLQEIYEKHEKEKKEFYESRVIHVERGNFTPLVFTTSGGMAPACQRFFKRVATMIADKRGQTYQHVVSYVRTRLRFAMLRSTLIAIRGFKGRVKNKELSVDEVDFNIIPRTMSVAI